MFDFFVWIDLYFYKRYTAFHFAVQGYQFNFKQPQSMTPEDFNYQFQTHIGQLKSYLVRITASKADAEDIAQDTYLRALDKLSSFRGESSLKTWLFTIASNIAKDNLRAKQRWPENITDIARSSAMHDEYFFKEAMQIRTTSPQGQYEAKEHIAFCFTCISKSLPLEQQLCIFLKDVYEFKVDEIAGILDTTGAMVKYYLHTGRTKMIDDKVPAALATVCTMLFSRMVEVLKADSTAIEITAAGIDVAKVRPTFRPR